MMIDPDRIPTMRAELLDMAASCDLHAHAGSRTRRSQLSAHARTARAYVRAMNATPDSIDVERYEQHVRDLRAQVNATIGGY